MYFYFPATYRHAEELADWQTRCTLHRSELALRADGLLDDGALSKMDGAIGAEIEDAVAYARASAFPDPATFDHFTWPGNLPSTEERGA